MAAKDAACSPLEQPMRATDSCYLPPEIIGEILCNLPIKSLIQFRCVSKSWRSFISDPKFIRKHLSRATRSDTLSSKKLLMNHYFTRFNLERAFFCSLSSISKQPIEETIDLICPFQGDDPYSRIELRAFCDELWCVEVNNSLYFWNPSMRSYRNLPDQPARPCPEPANRCITEAVYGMGYDSVGDDYKLLRVPCVHEDRAESDLYSLRSNSWRKLPPLAGNTKRRRDGQFVNGALHWMVDSPDPARPLVIISFDLSTEKYGEIPQPEYYPRPNTGDVHVAVLRGMLCVFVNYKETAFVLWVMKEYGIEKSWTKIFDIGCGGSLRPKLRREPWIRLIPVYLYENGEVLIWALVGNEWEMVLYKDEKAIAEEIVARGRSKIRDVFIYVESLISPAMWPSNTPIGNNEA